MNEVNMATAKFESIKHIDELGQEFWFARELAKILEYTEWRNFVKAINKAKVACKNSENNVETHFVEVNKMVTLGSGSQRNVIDFILTRYACYLIVQNSDPRKESVSLG